MVVIAIFSTPPLVFAPFMKDAPESAVSFPTSVPVLAFVLLLIRRIVKRQEKSAYCHMKTEHTGKKFNSV
jgi:hypothetical protein